MARFVDSHAHLADPAFADDVDAVIERARTTGAQHVIVIGESIAAGERARALASRHPGVLAWTAGVHPHDASGFHAGRDLPRLHRLLEQGAAAVGECGLDYHYDHSPRDLQLAAFAAQLDLAAEWQRPVVVHTRDAEDDTTRMVAEAGQRGIVGILHCFTGSAGLAQTAIDAGWYVSFSGIVTFRRWTDDALLRQVPDHQLLVESDSPYLAPVPHRGQRNEPAWVSLTLARVASARGVPADRLGALTTANAVRCFGLAMTPDA